MSEADVKELRDKLKAVGVGAVGLHTGEVRELAKVLHADESIGGVVYGKYTGGIAWLIATDKRVIFLDKKVFFTTMDELTYDVVSGVKSSHAGVFASIILHTRVHDYAMNYVVPKCAQIFVKFIEGRRLESGSYNVATSRHAPAEAAPPSFQNTSDEGLTFLKEHDLAVLSTVDRTGSVHGAVIYYLVDQSNLVYLLTKSETGKGRNVYAHSQVALTVHEPGTMQTLQLQGIAEVETDQTIKDKVFTAIVKPRPYRSKMELPPVAKLHEGAFMVIRISPTFMSYHDYSKTE